ncbi:hypothetical protein [Vibrio phage vB_pir03]|nr:hypothetical protein [Vibrio phage vB_pir03]
MKSTLKGVVITPYWFPSTSVILLGINTSKFLLGDSLSKEIN